MTELLADIATEYDRDGVADLCLAYARGQDWIDGVVVGMETEDQLDANLRLFVARTALAAGLRGDQRAAFRACPSASSIRRCGGRRTDG